jgi:oligopeptide/dipeptide ABC transporter ATP-binding protein
MSALLAVDDLVKHFPGPAAGQRMHALNGVTPALAGRETLAVVGESGSGKSTLARIALRLERPTQGSVHFEGRDITDLPERELRHLRARMQMVFQDPWGTLNPRMKIRALLEEPFLLHTRLRRNARREAAAALAGRVRLAAAVLDRHPSQLSGGQLQRVAIARALATGPSLVVLDEPTSSLDLSVRGEVLALLAELQRESGAGYIFISHDLGTVRLIADRIAVLYLGRVMEIGPAHSIFEAPQHPYTQTLFSAQLSTRPSVEHKRLRLSGEPPSPIDLPAGCVFHTRCPLALPECSRAPIPAAISDGGHQVMCVRAADGSNRIPN